MARWSSRPPKPLGSLVSPVAQEACSRRLRGQEDCPGVSRVDQERSAVPGLAAGSGSPSSRPVSWVAAPPACRPPLRAAPPPPPRAGSCLVSEQPGKVCLMTPSETLGAHVPGSRGQQVAKPGQGCRVLSSTSSAPGRGSDPRSSPQPRACLSRGLALGDSLDSSACRRPETHLTILLTRWSGANNLVSISILAP